MLLKGEALIQSVTLNFACHGERGDWRVSVSFGPGHISNDSETQDAMPYTLLDAMLKTTYAEVASRFPERVPYRDVRVRR
jgi:hypothetical protein